MEQGIKRVRKEVSILKIAQHRKVHNHAGSYQKQSLALCIALENSFPNKIIQERTKNEYANKESTGFVVKEKGNKKEI
jgi:hypothetical protein